MVKILKDHPADSTSIRDAYVAQLVEEAKKNPRIVAIDCDLSSSMGTKPFVKALPNQHFNVGIAEANGLNMAAGMADAGLIPFFHTFSCFASRRVYDQIFLSIYGGLKIHVMGGDAGLTTAGNGGTHMTFADIGMMRMMPEMIVMEASDSVMMKSLTKQLPYTDCSTYVRMPRKPLTAIYEEGSEFEIGKAVVLREGKDVSIITYGILVAEALKAADMLAAEGIEATVVDMFTIKPLDTDCLIRCAKSTGAVVVAENHNMNGGLMEGVAGVLAENCPVPMERVANMDHFGEVGNIPYLLEKLELTADVIAAKAKKAISRK